MDERAKSQLLFVPFTNILNDFSSFAKKRGLTTNKCAVIYTWPITPEEQELHERVLRLAEDLKSIGITPLLDLTHLNASSSIEDSLLSFILESDTVLLIGSPSLSKRASDPLTLTFKCCQSLSSKRSLHSNSVLPLLLAGDFPGSFPPGYTETLGAAIVTLSQYFQNFPEIVATLLDIRDHPLILSKLRQYRIDTQEILDAADVVTDEKEKSKLLSQSELQHKSWAARVLVLKSHFTPDQLRVLDGRIAASELQIEEYCKHMAKELEMSKVPQDITEGLENQLLDFLHNQTEQVLLLQAPQGSNKTQAGKFLAYKAWRELNWVPVVVDLRKCMDDQCVAKTLRTHLDDAAVQHAQATRTFLLLIEGFDKCNCQVNLYVRNSLNKWRGKVVFTCRSTYIGNSVQGPFYFMPADTHLRPQPQALRIISYTTASSEPPSVDEVDANPSGILVNSAIEVHQALLLEAAAINKPNHAKEHCDKVTTEIISTILEPTYTNEQRIMLEKGFSILQQDIIRPMFEDFLAKLPQLKPNGPKKAFISYAWPTSKSDCAALQSRLLTLVSDMELAGVKVLLDILCLSVGVNINEFMESGINSCDRVFWIGTPRLVERIYFKNGVPSNPATIEFCHIQKKFQVDPLSIHPLLFLGDNYKTSFPPLGDGSSPIHSTDDFRENRDYYKTLTKLAASVLGVDELPEFKRQYSEFCDQMQATESTFTYGPIMKRLEIAEKQVQQEAADKEERIRQLLRRIPEDLLHELEGTIEAQSKAFHSLLAQIQESAINTKSQALDLYIPLKGGSHLDTPPHLYFDVEKRVVEFLNSENKSKRVMLIQGGAGAGKSLFGCFLERHLWGLYPLKGFIPILVSLPKLRDPYSNLVGEALQNMGFSEGVEHLTSEKFVFILDGLDELPLEKMPTKGILISNGMLSLPNSRIIITSRNHYITALELKFGVTAHEHLTLQFSSVEGVFMMPFDTAQIHKYLSEYCRSPEAAWTDWTIFRQYIETIPGLATLAQTPFMLKLLTIALPRLITRVDLSLHIKSVDVYKAFIEMWFEREMWKQLIQFNGIAPTENRINGYFSIAQQLSQAMFEQGVTLIQATEFHTHPGQSLLAGLPLVQQQGNMSFIHKSVQEYFTARGWVSALTTNEAQILLGARLASSETGLLRFVAELYDHSLHLPLTKLVLASQAAKGQPTISTAAANAITILNATQFSFSGMDFSGIDIQGAILDNAMMDKTNLSGSNLTEVSFRQAWLEGANLSNATLSLASFGQQADIILPEICCSVINTKGGFVAITVHGRLHEHNNRSTKIRTTTERVISAASYNNVLYLGTIEGTIVAWDLLEEEPAFHRINTGSGRVLSIAVSEKYIISGGSDHTISVWNRFNGTFVTRLRGHTQRVCSIAVQGDKIFSGSADNSIRIWDLKTFTQCNKIDHFGSVQCLLMTEGRIISGSDRGTIHIWESSTGALIGDLLGHTSNITCLAFFDGKIISGSVDSNVLVWDMATYKTIEVMMVYSPVVSLLMWNGKVVVGCDNKKVQVWDFASKPRLQKDKSTSTMDTVKSISVAEGTITIARETTIQIIDALTHSKVVVPLMHSQEVRCMVQDHNSTLSWGGEFMSWASATGQVQTRISVPQLDVEFMEVYGDTIVAAGWSGLYLIPLNSEPVLAAPPPLLDTPILAISVDQLTGIIAYMATTKIDLLDITTGNNLGELSLDRGLTCIKCSEGKLLLAIRFAPEVEVWDLTTRTRTASLIGHSTKVIQMATFGGRMASTDGKSIRVWHISTGQCLFHLNFFDEEIQSIAISALWLVAICEGDFKKRFVKWWRMDEVACRIYLVGVDPDMWPLKLRECNVKGVLGISTQQQDLLLQLGAKF